MAKLHLLQDNFGHHRRLHIDREPNLDHFHQAQHHHIHHHSDLAYIHKFGAHDVPAWKINYLIYIMATLSIY